ncbi:MAG TPA: hypothetical protein PK264_12915, partial [Hyphomicrobiaceae bacterium]|nr:hypothetical protein [Hyphomicrobiaceae bacterium]
ALILAALFAGHELISGELSLATSYQRSVMMLILATFALIVTFNFALWRTLRRAQASPRRRSERGRITR